MTSLLDQVKSKEVQLPSMNFVFLWQVSDSAGAITNMNPAAAAAAETTTKDVATSCMVVYSKQKIHR